MRSKLGAVLATIMTLGLASIVPVQAQTADTVQVTVTVADAELLPVTVTFWEYGEATQERTITTSGQTVTINLVTLGRVSGSDFVRELRVFPTFDDDKSAMSLTLTGSQVKNVYTKPNELMLHGWVRGEVIDGAAFTLIGLEVAPHGSNPPGQIRRNFGGDDDGDGRTNLEESVEMAAALLSIDDVTGSVDLASYLPAYALFSHPRLFVPWDYRDTDGDGLDDAYEMTRAATDPDGDNVPNAYDVDSDGDGLFDDEETSTPWMPITNPYLVDTDSDGASDYRELRDTNTNPTDAQANPATCDIQMPTNDFKHHDQAIMGAWRLYQAFFLRQPDEAGYAYWRNLVEQDLVTLNDAAAIFADSIEFAATYGPLTNAEFMQLVYDNVLCRTPDAAGFNYWVSLLNEGVLNRGQLMTQFSESTEYRRISFSDAALFSE